MYEPPIAKLVIMRTVIAPPLSAFSYEQTQSAKRGAAVCESTVEANKTISSRANNQLPVARRTESS